MFSCIKDIEYYLPEKVLTNDELSELYGEWNSEKIFDKVGIRQRHIAGTNETAVDLGENAALNLFKKNSNLKDQIDFIIFCTQSPDYYLPTSACILQKRLGISTACGAFDYNLGCSGFISGLAIAKSFIKTGIAKNILLITAETYSKYINPLDRSSRTIFGDGAAATWVGVVEEHEYIFNFAFKTDGYGAASLIVPAGGLRLPRSPETAIEVCDENGNIRSQENLYMNGGEIFNFSISKVPILFNELLKNNKVSKDSIDYFIFHQANKFMLTHLRKKINIPEEKFYNNIEEVGNTVSSTIPIALVESVKLNKIKKGHKIMLVGFGVGYSWNGCIIEWY
jgi:3-oxoacyl-[acyl-carrier-protein] synthase-3